MDHDHITDTRIMNRYTTSGSGWIASYTKAWVQSPAKVQERGRGQEGKGEGKGKVRGGGKGKEAERGREENYSTIKWPTKLLIWACSAC